MQQTKAWHKQKLSYTCCILCVYCVLYCCYRTTGVCPTCPEACLASSPAGSSAFAASRPQHVDGGHAAAAPPEGPARALQSAGTLQLARHGQAAPAHACVWVAPSVEWPPRNKDTFTWSIAWPADFSHLRSIKSKRTVCGTVHIRTSPPARRPAFGGGARCAAACAQHVPLPHACKPLREWPAAAACWTAGAGGRKGAEGPQLLTACLRLTTWVNCVEGSKVA